jgi:hypothetical protein
MENANDKQIYEQYLKELYIYFNSRKSKNGAKPILPITPLKQ